MPFIYETQSQMQAATYSTSGTPSTEIDVFSIKPGASRPCNIRELRGQGRGAGLTALTGIELNLKLWTTASTGGTALTPSPKGVIGNVAAVSVPRIGTGGGVNAVTPGTGGGTYRGGFGFSGSGPGGWNTLGDPDAEIQMDGGYAGSIDLYSISGVASMLYSFYMLHREG